MAVSNPGNIDNFELEWCRVRQTTEVRFGELIDCLKTREEELLREMDGILADYHSYRSKLENVKEKKIEIERAKIYHQNELASSRIKSVHEKFISQLDTELKSIETPIEPKMVSFECDSNKMLAELRIWGKLVGKVRSGIDYKSKKHSLEVVSVCEKGNGERKLNNPLDVTVDNTIERMKNEAVHNKCPYCKFPMPALDFEIHKNICAKKPKFRTNTLPSFDISPTQKEWLTL